MDTRFTVSTRTQTLQNFRSMHTLTLFQVTATCIYILSHGTIIRFGVCSVFLLGFISGGP